MAKEPEVRARTEPERRGDPTTRPFTVVGRDTERPDFSKASAEDIQEYIDAKRDEIEADLDLLETRVSRLTDLRRHARNHPMVVVGIGLAIGLILGWLLGDD